MPGPAHLRHRPALDAIRGLAVLIVVAFHSGFGLARGGYLGVSTFFTLSGFLIATLVMVEHHNAGSVDLRAFWRRRFRRLLPAAVVTIGLVVVLVWAIGDAVTRSSIGGDAASSLLYVANWHMIFAGTSYAQLFVAPGPLLHMWSLAVEEQFYVVFPLVIAALTTRRWRTGPRALPLRARLGVFAGVVIVVSLLEPIVLHLGVDRTYFGTDTRAAEIAIGILLAVALFPFVSGTGPRTVPGREWRVALAVASSVAFVAMAAAWASIPETSPFWRDGGFALYATGSALLIAAGVLAVGPVGLMGGLRPLCRLGLISYAVYLVHWPILWVLSVETDWGPWPRFVVSLGASVAIAEVSMRLLEGPVRRTGRVGRVPALAAIPVVGAVVLVGAVLVDHTAPPPVIDFAAAAAAARQVDAGGGADPAPAAGGAAAPERVAFFGDSTALMTGFGFASAVADDPRVVSVGGWAEMGCGLVVSTEVRNDEGVTGHPTGDCANWPDTWERQAGQSRPDIAVVQVGPWETFDFRWDGTPGWHHLGDPVADEEARTYLQEAVDRLSASGARVVFLTASHVDRRRSGPEPCACPERLDRFNELMAEVAAANPGRAAVVDLAGWLRSLGDEDLRLRPDGVHFSEQTADEVARRWLIDNVLGAVPAPSPPDTEEVPTA